MSTIRDRAREAAEGPGRGTIDVETFIEGYLAAHEQLPGRDEIARAMHADDLAHDRAADAWEDMSAESHDWYRSNADAVLALLRGTDS